GLVQECVRVLRSGGIARFVVPDLEQIIRGYLTSLEAVTNGERSSERNYDWYMLELYDQVVRTTSGGAMAAFLGRVPESERELVRGRIGEEADKFWLLSPSSPRRSWSRLWARRRSYLARARGMLALPFVAAVGGRALAGQLRNAQFRSTGEIHQWM